MKERGLSTVIATVIMIVLVMAAIVMVWSAINNMIRNKTEGAQACFDVGFSEKVVINEDYTCYNSTDDMVQFSLSVADVDIDGVLVAISSAGNSKSYVITNTPQTITGLLNYPDGSTSIVLPSKNSGKTYLATGFSDEVDSIKIAPIVGDKQCEQSDEIHQIEDCMVFI
jgi:hypothetical protein